MEFGPLSSAERVIPSPVPFRKVRRLLENAGWGLARISGSHHLFKHPETGGVLSIPVHKNQVKPCYVREIEKTIARQSEGDDAGTEEAV